MSRCLFCKGEVWLERREREVVCFGHTTRKEAVQNAASLFSGRLPKGEIHSTSCQEEERSLVVTVGWYRPSQQTKPTLRSVVPGVGLSIPLARGSPYITAEASQVRPTITSNERLGAQGVQINGVKVPCDGPPFVGKSLSFHLEQSDVTWALFAPEGTLWSCLRLRVWGHSAHPLRAFMPSNT